jgi:hypothetical protein
MHKDLNTQKYAVKAMQAFWDEAKLTRPIYLPSKDKAEATAALETAGLSLTEKPSARGDSNRGAVRVSTLGGLICKNPDSKRGQQDHFGYYMSIEENLDLTYPDVSNTWYGSHGAACCYLFAFTLAFLAFMVYVEHKKDTPGLTNIEKNFCDGLNDDATMHEIVTHALYHLGVARPFMAFIRGDHNMLDMGPYFAKKRTFLVSVCDHPDIWLSEDTPLENCTLDGHDWSDEAVIITLCARLKKGELPHLRGVIKAFLTGAIEGWDIFTAEFAKGGAIDSLTSTERLRMFFLTINDVNEGTLGSYRISQRGKP